ncbi:MAG: HAD family hydrolase [Bdellovibrionota bacterium]
MDEINLNGPTAFLDRDGTIMEDTGYPRDPSIVSLCPNASEGLRLLRKKGYRLVVVSNQAGVGRGIITRNQFRAVHARFNTLLAEAGIRIDQYLYCFHHPDDGCSCRKPATGLVESYLRQSPHDQSFMVGDKLSDLELGSNLGMASFLVLTGEGNKTKEKLGAENTAYKAFPNLLDLAESLEKAGSGASD